MASMSPEAVARRLRTMAELSAREPSPMPAGVDMSPSAIAMRLREMAEVSELCRRLQASTVRDS